MTANDKLIAESTQFQRYKTRFLNSIFLLAALMALGIGLYRWHFSPLLATVDFVFAGVALALLGYLMRHPGKIELVGSIALVVTFLLFFAIYLLAPYQTNRLSLFFLLSAAAFFLKGLRIGIYWLAFIIAAILGTHFAPFVATGFSGLDIATTCLYLVALFAIFHSYETLKADQYRREKDYELQRLIDERWRLAIEGAGDAVWDWDLDSGSFQHSKSYATMLGYDEDDIGSGSNPLQKLIHPEDEAAAMARLKSYLDGEFGGQYVFEQRMRCADGSYKWILCRGRVTVRDARGRPQRMVGTHVDITEIKRVEATLLESQKRLQIALDSAGMGVWDYEVASGRLYWSPEVYRILGMDYFEPTLERFTRLMHPDDRDRVSAAFDQALAERKSFFAQFRVGDEGRQRWVEDHAEVQCDNQGRPVRVIGVVQDISERVRVQEEILRSQQTLEDQRGLFQTILDNAPLGIWMVDPLGRVQFVNRSFCDATGIPEASFLAANHYADLLPAEVGAGCLKSDRECLAQDTPHVSSEWLPFVDGRDHLLEITKVRLLERDGSIRGLIGIAADVTERMEHQKQLERLAHYDALTGVPNRVLLADRMKQALARTKREQSLMAVCYLDLDGFKPVNDTLGHGAGDKVLVEVTRRIREAVREDDTVARLGGDEFVVLLVGLKAAEECVGSLHRLLESIKQPITVSDSVLTISASIGVALYPDDEQDADTLLRHADQAMYVAKQAGRNRYHLFDPVSDLRARSHHQLLQQIRKGLAEGEFELYYQPKVEMRTRRLVGVESLIRWHHPERGLLLPADFLRAIENTELEIELGDWVIATAFDQMRKWRQAGHEFEVSVNVSAYHLQSPKFVTKLRVLMQDCCPQRCVNCIQIEVLETAALEDIALISELIRNCKEIGVGFALDDFGTGYSSLTYLSKLDVDTLKIDQSFVRDMHADKGDHAVVQGIIALARAFEMKIVAEGVENDAIYQALLAMGCEVGQGHGIARPMPAAELLRWRATSRTPDFDLRP